MAMRAFFADRFFYEKKEEKDNKETQVHCLSDFLHTIYKKQPPVYFYSSFAVQYKSKKLADDAIMKLFRQDTCSEYKLLKEQVIILIEGLKSWCAKQEWHTTPEVNASKLAEIHNELDRMKKNLFNQDFISEQTAVSFYDQGKKHLESLLYQITFLQHNPILAKTVILNLVKEASVCAPGISKAIYEAYTRFISDIEKIFQIVRLETLEQAALIFKKEAKKNHDKHNNMEKHFSIALTNYVADEYAIPKIQDEYADSAADYEDYVLFQTRFLRQSWILELFFDKLTNKYAENIFHVETYQQAQQYVEELDKLGDDPLWNPTHLFGAYKLKMIETEGSEKKEEYSLEEVPEVNDKNEIQYRPLTQIVDEQKQPIKAINEQYDLLYQTIYFRFINSGLIEKKAFRAIHYKKMTIYILDGSPLLSFIAEPKMELFKNYIKTINKTELFTLLGYLAKEKYITQSFVDKILPNLSRAELKQLRTISKTIFYAYFIKYAQSKEIEKLKYKGVKSTSLLLSRMLIKLCEVDFIDDGTTESVKYILKNTRWNFPLLKRYIREGFVDFSGVDFRQVKFDFSDAPKTGKIARELILTNARLDTEAFQTLSRYRRDFSHVDLREVNFTVFNTEAINFNFSYANLSGANFSNVQVFNSNFFGADLNNANFENATLSTVVFEFGATVIKAHMESANLMDANFRGACGAAEFDGATFNEKSLSSFILESKYDKSHERDLRKIILVHNENLQHLVLEQCLLSGNTLAELYKAGVRRFKSILLEKPASLINLNLSHADFSDMDLSGINFTNTDLRGASFKSCHFAKSHSQTIFAKTIYGQIPSEYINRFLKYADGSHPLQLCKILLIKECLSVHPLLKFTKSLQGKNFDAEVIEALQENNFSQFKSVADLVRFLPGNAKLVPGVLQDVLRFCEMVEENIKTLYSPPVEAKQNERQHSAKSIIR